jgi:predicted permease
MSSVTLESVWQDVRRAVLGLRRDAALAATVVVTLGLGIGANAAMFNVVDRLMFRPLAYLRDPSSVHRLYWQWQQRGTISTTTSTYYTRYLDLQRDTSSFALLAAFSERDLAVGDGELARERRVSAVSASYFDLFDARPVLGRFFTSAEDVTPRGADVAVLGYGFWQTMFAGRGVLGERIHVGNIQATIIGVAPPGFHGVGDGTPAAVFVPITTFAGSTGTGDASTYFSKYQWGWINVLARRKPSVSVAQAELDADQAFRHSWQAGSADDPRLPPVDLARPHVVVGSVRPGAGPTPALEARTAFWLAGVSGLVLCVAVANVANLLLARALRRRYEIALRLALGVSRPRLYRQALIEGVILALMSAVAAIVAAEWAGGSIRRLLVGTDTVSTPVFLDVRTLVVTALLAVIAGLFVAFIPVRVSSRSDLSHVLRGGVRGGVSDGTWLRASLLVVQAALSVILLIGAALFVRSQAAVEGMSMGYDATDVMLVNRVIRGSGLDEAAHRALRTSLLAAAQAQPQIESAAWVNSVPFGSTSSATLIVPGIGNTESLASFS